jgi:hypothetical protein
MSPTEDEATALSALQPTSHDVTKAGSSADGMNMPTVAGVEDTDHFEFLSLVDLEDSGNYSNENYQQIKLDHSQDE